MAIGRDGLRLPAEEPYSVYATAVSMRGREGVTTCQRPTGVAQYLVCDEYPRQCQAAMTFGTKPGKVPWVAPAA